MGGTAVGVRGSESRAWVVRPVEGSSGAKKDEDRGRLGEERGAAGGRRLLLGGRGPGVRDCAGGVWCGNAGDR